MASNFLNLKYQSACVPLCLLMSYGGLMGADKVLKIGNIIASTGMEAYGGQSANPALEDYVKKLNASGGINGYKIQLISYDNRGELTESVTAAKRLISQDRVIAAIGPVSSSAGIPIAKIADEAKVPFVATTATNINVTVDESGKVHPYMFRVCFIDPYQGYALAEFAYKKLGKRKAALLTDVASPYTVGLHKYFEGQFKKLGGKIVATESYNKGDNEFRAQLTNIKTSGADLLVAAADNYKDAALFAQQSKTLGLKITMVGGDGWFIDDLLPMAGTVMEGSYLSSPSFTDAPEFAKFNAAFKAKHNVNASIFTYFHLDALMLIEYGIRESMKKNGGVPTAQGVRDAMEKAKKIKLFTGDFTMEPDTHNPHNKPVFMLQIHDSKWRLAEVFKPS
jgi:branched-chain amino acid transport system substrate-binding protein